MPLLFAILLTVLFVGLKLTGFIAWSWFLVVLPLIVWMAVIALILAVAGGLAIVVARGDR